MISDFEQPARLWLADVMKQIAEQIKNGDEPVHRFELEGVEMGVFVSYVPGMRRRKDEPDENLLQ